MKKNILKYARSYGLGSVVVLKTLKILLGFVIVATILMTVAYNTLNISMRKELMSKNTVELKKTAVLFENFFREAEYLAAGTIIDKEIMLFTSMSDGTKIVSPQKQRLTDKTRGYSFYNTGVKNMYIYSEKNGYVISAEDVSPKSEFANEFWFKEIEKNDIDDYKIVFQKKPDSFLNSIFFIKRSAENLVYVIVELDIYTMKNRLEDIASEGSRVYIMMDGEIIYSNMTYKKPDWLEKCLSEDSGFLKSEGLVFGRQQSYYYGYDCIICSADTEYMHGVKNMYALYIVIFVALIGTLAFISIYMSMDSLSYITDFMEIFETKKQQKKLKDNEIKYISDKIVYLINDNETLKKEVEKKIADYNAMQYKALQKQITPHFINNSLTALGVAVIDELGYEGSSLKMITRLSRIIKYSYISDETFVTIGEELGFLSDYAEFLKCRYKNFEFSINCDEKLYGVRILKMIMQPFAENAVFYGISDKKCSFEVGITEKEGFIEAEFYDNGRGMSPEKITEILKYNKNDSFDSEKIGIKNVYRRLKIIYGDKSKMTIESEEGKFTRIKIIFPKEERDGLKNEKEN